MSLTHQQIIKVLEQNAIQYTIKKSVISRLETITFNTYTMQWCIAAYRDIFMVKRESLPGSKNGQHPAMLIRYVDDLIYLLRGDHAMIKRRLLRKFITLMQPVVWAAFMSIYPFSDKIFKPSVNVDYIMFSLMGFIAAYNVYQFLEILHLRAKVTFTQRKLDKVTREFETFDSL